MTTPRPVSRDKMLMNFPHATFRICEVWYQKKRSSQLEMARSTRPLVLRLPFRLCLTRFLFSFVMTPV